MTGSSRLKGTEQERKIKNGRKKDINKTETNNKISDEGAENEDIDVISQQVPDLDRSKIIEVYKKNNKDVVDTIIELTA